jgi:hypothetical protein
MIDVRATNTKLRDRAARIVSTLTGVDRAAALKLLDRAGGSAKVAVVVARRGLSPARARGWLRDHSLAGTIAPISIEHFMINLMALCNYPLIAKPMVQDFFHFDEAAYKKFLLERRNVVLQTLFTQKILTQDLK